MKAIPDIIIAAGVIGCVIALGAGFRWVGVGCLLMAILVGWKRDWCIAAFDELGGIRKAGADLDDGRDHGANVEESDAADDH